MCAATPPMDQKGEVVSMLQHHLLDGEDHLNKLADYAAMLWCVTSDLEQVDEFNNIRARALDRVTKELQKVEEALWDWHYDMVAVARVASESPQRAAAE